MSIALLLSLAVAPALAQAPRANPPAPAPVQAAPAPRAAPPDAAAEKLAAEKRIAERKAAADQSASDKARRAMDAKMEANDRKMRRAMYGICSGCLTKPKRDR